MAVTLHEVTGDHFEWLLVNRSQPAGSPGFVWMTRTARLSYLA